MKLLLKEKESQYFNLNDELRALKDKHSLVEKSNQKLQLDLENAINKLNEMSNESDKYTNYLRACEEQFNMSEKKREDLKQDAQETIKLFVLILNN